MAKYKLKLSKLDFVSLVDTPAQETATLRLLKRKGGDDEIQATAIARLAKIGEGDNPLAYFWAFTCTDEAGAPYHDLQGDAISSDFVKAAEEFLRNGAAVDEMHDSAQTSRVAFAFPMDADIASGMFGSSIGGLIKTSGLMVAIRPSVEALAKLRSGVYTGVSIAGLGVREAMKAAKKPKKKPPTDAAAAPYKRVGKMAVLTSEEDGHAHSVDLDDPARCSWTDNLSTSAQTAEGATDAHCHAWIYDATTGAITIAMDSGHSHTVSVVVPADVLAAAAADEAVPEPVIDEPSSGSTVNVVIAARAISTPSESTRSVKAQEQSMATEHEIKILDLEKQLVLAKQHATLTDAQRAHLNSITDSSERNAFLAKNQSERNAIVEPLELAKRAAIDAGNEVVYVAKADGSIYRKRDDERLVAMAKHRDEAVLEAETTRLEKRAAADLGNLPGVVAVKVAALRAADHIADETMRKSVFEMLRAGNAAMAQLGRSAGISGGLPSEGDPLTAWNVGLKKHAESIDPKMHPIDAMESFLKTAEGKGLKAAYDETRGYAQAGAR